MNDTIVYRPHKTQTWTLFLTTPVGILAFVGSGYCLSLSGICFLFLAGIGLACIWLTKLLYVSSKKTVFFDEKGIQIIGDDSSGYRYIPWGEFQYAYYARNYKGHLFLILSPNSHSPKEARCFANQGANSSRISIDDVVVIYMDIQQDISKVREMIDNHILHVDIYR